MIHEVHKSRISTEVHEKTRSLIDQAKEDALARLPATAKTEATRKVIKSIERRFAPHVKENEEIADQLTSPKYKKYVAETREILGVESGSVVCPDGRILYVAIADPLVGRIQRRLQGLPETRPSSLSDDSPVLSDPDITASINFAANQSMKANGANPEFVEFIGPHIHSTDPIHGCGAAKGKVTEGGRPAVTAMEFGGIENYFDELGNNFNAFNTVANRAGGYGTTFDMTHDAHSQGLIFGLRNAYQQMQIDPALTLRQNLIDLHRRKKILMTEMIDYDLGDEIKDTAASAGITSPLDIRNPAKLAQNNMAIGKISREITQNQEITGFPLIPRGIIENTSKNAIRTLAYYATRNSVYRRLSGIKPGEHDLLNHPEELIRVGPIGAAYNVRSIPFIQVTPHGELRPQDFREVEKLYGLAEDILPKINGDLANEARLIITTGEYDETIYDSPLHARKALEEVASVVKNNAANLRARFKDGVNHGETVVLGVLHESGSRRLTHVLSSR